MLSRHFVHTPRPRHAGSHSAAAQRHAAIAEEAKSPSANGVLAGRQERGSRQMSPCELRLRFLPSTLAVIAEAAARRQMREIVAFGGIVVAGAVLRAAAAV